jgi:hypothetical protein
MIKRQNYGFVATVCDLRFNINVFQNLWPGLDGNANRNRVRIQFTNTFNQYNCREKAIQTEARIA